MSGVRLCLFSSVALGLASAGACAVDGPQQGRSESPPSAARAFNTLEGGMALGPKEAAASSAIAVSFDAELAVDADMNLLDAELHLAGCELGALEVVSVAADVDDYEVAVAEGVCGDGRIATLQAMRARDMQGIIALTLLMITLDDTGTPTSIETVEVVAGEIVHDAIDMASAQAALMDDMNLCTPDDSDIDVACTASALSIDKCWVCKKVAALVIGQAGRVCGWGGVAACGALGLAGGAPGLVCAASLWSICKLGINQVKSWGAERVCRYLGYCG